MLKNILKLGNNAKPFNINLINTRSYAVKTGNHPESLTNIKDPQGLKNNPSIGIKNMRHKEIHVQKCIEDPQCTDKTCNTICGTPGERYATAHMTHGNPTTTQGTVVPLTPTDYMGNNKHQNSVIYSHPHKTSVTPEIPALTSYTQNSQVKQILDAHENLP